MGWRKAINGEAALPANDSTWRTREVKEGVSKRRRESARCTAGRVVREASLLKLKRRRRGPGVFRRSVLGGSRGGSSRRRIR